MNPLHPELKDKAQAAVSKAKAAGTLIPQPCEVCGKAKADAHHADYSKPLEVRWLCRSHHKITHGHEGASILGIRAKITKDEWKAFRGLALDRGVSSAALAGDALRALLKGAKP